MKKNERQQAIVSQVETKGACTYQELEEVLGVSTMTIRRDVEQLASEGKLTKTLGGVQRANAPMGLYESSLLTRLNEHLREKRAIAHEAVKLIQAPASIFLDGSSTCIEVARVLAAQTAGLTIATHSMLVYMELAKGKGNTIICLGGQHDPSSFCLTGPQTEEDMRAYYFDKAFFSTKGLIAEEGTFESSAATFRVKQIVAERCGEIILLIDHSKFGRRALRKVLDIGQLHTVITDEGAAESDVQALRRHVQTVVVAAEATREKTPPARMTKIAAAT